MQYNKFKVCNVEFDHYTKNNQFNNLIFFYKMASGSSIYEQKEFWIQIQNTRTSRQC